MGMGMNIIIRLTYGYLNPLLLFLFLFFRSLEGGAISTLPASAYPVTQG